MDGESLDIFAEDNARFVCTLGANAKRIEEQSSAGPAFVIVSKSLSFPRQTKSLAGKARQANVKIGNIRSINLCDIACDLKGVDEICAIGFTCWFIQFACEDGFDVRAKGLFESHPDSTNASK